MGFYKRECLWGVSSYIHTRAREMSAVSGCPLSMISTEKSGHHPGHGHQDASAWITFLKRMRVFWALEWKGGMSTA